MNSINLKWNFLVISFLEMASNGNTIVDWTTLTFVHDVQIFFGFANLYRCFISHYSKIVAFFTCLTQKDQPFPRELKLTTPSNL